MRVEIINELILMYVINYNNTLQLKIKRIYVCVNIYTDDIDCLNRNIWIIYKVRL